jgi:ATP-dependent RNA helicase MSS116, mitochondrial
MTPRDSILHHSPLIHCPPLDVHRLGRTARAGNEGSGLLILAPWEQRFLANKDMVNIPIKEQAINENELKLSLANLKDAVDTVMITIEDKTRCSAYQVSP